MLAFIVLAALSAALVSVMSRMGTLDHPGARSSHTRPTPKGGGVGILAASCAGLIWAGHPALVLPALFLGAVSYLDDLYDWRFTAKLAAQTVAAGAAIWAGLTIHDVHLPGQPALALGAFGPGLALAWFLFVTNAVNFMDGLNGLASGSVGVAAGLAAVGWPEMAQAQPLPLLAGIVGFLPFNYPRACLFMGDVGSQACGFLVAALAVAGVETPRYALVIPLALAPMLMDVAFTLLRRARAGQLITQAHRGHLYQVAHRAGVTAWLVTLAYWGMALWGGSLGIILGSPRGAQQAVPIPIIIALVVALAPFAMWAYFVNRVAARAGITEW